MTRNSGARHRLGALAALLAVAALLQAGCTLTSPFDPAGVFAPINEFVNEAQNAVEGAVANPFGNNPYPVVIGGDSTRVFYATNLGDTLIRFPGPTNDIVLPGLLGPSNLYMHQNGVRTLLRPLVPGNTFFGLTTNGEDVAFVQVIGVDADGPRMQVVVGGLFVAGDRVVYEAAPGEYVFDLHLSGELLAIGVVGGAGARLIVVDLTDDGQREFSEAVIHSFDLRDRRLVYIADDQGEAVVLLRDLVSNIETELARGVRTPASVFLTDNFVVWTDAISRGVERVWAYDIRDGTTRLWADAVQGQVRGASDDFFVTQERIVRGNGSVRLVIRRYAAAGASDVLGEFPANGRAGQAQIRGQRIIFVNSDRRVVVVPLGEGRRFNFRPF
jgi:hypothetical protein